MFVRINESGGRRYLQIVESYRNEAGKPRHRVVANLGRIDGMQDDHLDTLIRGLCRVTGRDEPAKLEISHAPARAFGDVFALHALWTDLGFDRALGRALRSGKRTVEDDIRAFGMNKEMGSIARQFVLGVVQTADGLPLMHTVHPGNVAETKTLQAMLQTVLQRFPIQRVILVADRGLLSLDNIDELTGLADKGDRRLEFILAVPARRYTELVESFQRLSFDETGLAESTFADHRLIVAHDPLRAAEQGDRRRARIAELEAMAEKMVGKLDAQDGGQTAKGRRASDRGAYSRFTRAVAEAELTRFIKADLAADRFSWTVDEAAVANAELFDGKLALITNAPDLTAADAVARYKALADIERGFRVLKSDIEIAPVHHRLPDRIRAHALICFLALVLYRVMRMRLKAKGHSASPRTALDLLARIQRHHAKIGDRSVQGLSTTTPEQLELFDTLNLPKPA